MEMVIPVERVDELLAAEQKYKEILALNARLEEIVDAFKGGTL
jgi:hypothetical protein